MPGVLLKCECVVAYRCVHVCVLVRLCVEVGVVGCAVSACYLFDHHTNAACSFDGLSFFPDSARFVNQPYLTRFLPLFLSARTNAFAYACRRTDARAFQKDNVP